VDKQVSLSTGVVHRSGPRSSIAVSAGPRPTHGDDLTTGRALTGWTAGAHVPAVQLSSLPLDEWHYMCTNNETGLGPVATSTPTSTLAGGAGGGERSPPDHPQWTYQLDQCHRFCHRERGYHSHSRQESQRLVLAKQSRTDQSA
jgi:hypothetical protein